MTDVLYSSAFITAHAAKYMLNSARIRAMLAAPTVQAVLLILADCGYEVRTMRAVIDDEIIDTERQKTLDTFLHLCGDAALAACIKAKYDFSMMQKDRNTTYQQHEKELFDTITQNLNLIKNKNIQNYLRTELEFLEKGQKDFEKQDAVLYKLACIDKNNTDSLSPLFHWYILKQTEFKVVKAILMGKRFEFSREVIMENLRGLHERFT